MGAVPRGRLLKPAVGVMAKVPGLEPVKSRLHQALTQEMATVLYRCFLLDRLEALATLPGIDALAAFTPPTGRARMVALAPEGFRLVAQQGRDLGERLSNLLAGLLASGHPGAMAIDSDSPTLPMAHVREAAEVLARGAADLVLGPSDDGGYYLVGLRRGAPGLFEGIPWSTDRVLPLTIEKAGRLGLRTHLLPEWFDVDTEADLRRLHAALLAGEGPRRTRRCLEAIYG
ncbi:MAG: hypothetical protein A2X51_05710 [Candidatus Rokubacteria bacterium GWC2_70_24]|nr:MAG: hypothetical protein A2X53_07890 [Candidatus Rokubacteria bacterium GWA2_70_23]OGK86866.1 MAG: hypothetical protein A2X51_05710 [Candidatus Rokubacteria bacterium GWC2_70_24]OGK89374.1 MAG: hypothetical protein A2X50_05055 [Candidatus Rokubacteria bacterium GWF2_70_14]